MANVYVYSGAAGSGDGSDWTNAYTTLSAALTAKAAGDTFWVAHDHASSTAGTVTLTSPGTAANPCRIFCVDRAGSIPPVAADLRKTATITTTGNFAINFAGFAYCYGIIFSAGTGNSASSNINFSSTASWWWRLEACSFRIASTSAVPNIIFGLNVPSAGVDDQRIELVDTTVSFGAAGQSIYTLCDVEWKNTASATLGTVPTNLFKPNPGANFTCHLSGVDLSAINTSLCLVSTALTTGAYKFENCKLHASVTPVNGVSVSPGGVRVNLVNCDSGDTNYRYRHHDYTGDAYSDITVVRTGGASDGTTAVSRKMVTTANSKIFLPLVSDPILFWNETTGSAITVSIPVVTDNVTLTDAEAWIEVEHHPTSGSTQSSFASDRAATILTTPANQTTDAVSAWTTTGLTTPVKQMLSVSFTPAEKGVVQVRVKLAKASTTMYFDPLAQVS